MTILALEKLIGRCGEVEGKWLEVIEIIHDGPQIVLKETGTKTSILNNQYGEANSLTYETFSVPLHSALNDDLHPVIKQLLGEKESEELLLAILKNRET